MVNISREIKVLSLPQYTKLLVASLRHEYDVPLIRIIVGDDMRQYGNGDDTITAYIVRVNKMVDICPAGCADSSELRSTFSRATLDLYGL